CPAAPAAAQAPPIRALPQVRFWRAAGDRGWTWLSSWLGLLDAQSNSQAPEGFQCRRYNPAREAAMPLTLPAILFLFATLLLPPDGWAQAPTKPPAGDASGREPSVQELGETMGQAMGQMGRMMGDMAQTMGSTMQRMLEGMQK